MAIYCVMTADESDVTMYSMPGKISCMGCKFQATDEDGEPIPPIKQTDFASRAEALDHLGEHRQKGHLVPDEALMQLRAEIERVGYEVA